MKIRAVRLQSFKSFEDTGWIELGSHFTVLTGENNMGKSAFLEVFAPTIAQNSPHRSAKREPASAIPQSLFTYQLFVPGQEHRRKALANGISLLPTTRELGVGVMDLHYKQDNVYELWTNPGSSDFTLNGAPTYGLFTLTEGWLLSVAKLNDTKDEFGAADVQSKNNYGENLNRIMSDMLVSTTFLFDAERYNIGRSTMADASRLNPDASNLPYMLSKLAKDHSRFERFQALVSEVLPRVRRVLVSPAGNQMEISIQSDPSFREDLAVPLDQSGTGVAQVVAILYVLVAYDQAQIVIDEPNSFLHPGAIRRLLNVLKRFDNHQYVLTTHTADVISIVEPERLLLLTWDDDRRETSISSSSGADIEHLKAALGEIGASVSDVFGYDVVVFVEGPTEAACFPLLVPTGRLAINFVPMREASAFSVRDPRELFEIYRRAVDAGTILPQVTRFSFDREGRSERQVEDMERAARGAGDAAFLPGMMYESHLLHPVALAILLNKLSGESGHTAESVASFIEREWPGHGVKGVENTSLMTCDAARLLAALVSQSTEARHQYNKIEHGKKLTAWLIANDPDHLAAVRAHVESLLPSAPRIRNAQDSGAVH